MEAINFHATTTGNTTGSSSITTSVLVPAVEGGAPPKQSQDGEVGGNSQTAAPPLPLPLPPPALHVAHLPPLQGDILTGAGAATAANEHNDALPLEVPAPTTETTPTSKKAGSSKGGKLRSSSKHRSWEQNFAALVVYKEKNGDTLVPVLYEADPALGRWCAKQRKNKETLAPERLARLEYLGFSFVDPKKALEDKNWNDNFEALKLYYARNDGSKLDPALNRWVSRQRRNRKDGIPSLTEERMRKLESIGFKWQLVQNKQKDYSKKDLHWINQYNELANFKKLHKHCNVPHSNPDYASLAKWVARQRELYFQKRLLENRKDLLNKLGFCWSMEEKAWRENFERFSAFVTKHNTLDFPKHNEHALSRWWYGQRLRRANGNLSDERIRLIESLGVRFNGTKAYLVTGDTPSQSALKNDAPKSVTEQVFTLEFPMRATIGTKIRKKRFMEGWCNGEVLLLDSKGARVKYEDGDEEYLEEEEFRLCTIAYLLYASPPKLSIGRNKKRKVSSGSTCKQPAKKRATTRATKKGQGDEESKCPPADLDESKGTGDFVS